MPNSARRLITQKRRKPIAAATEHKHEPLLTKANRILALLKLRQTNARVSTGSDNFCIAIWISREEPEKRTGKMPVDGKRCLLPDGDPEGRQKVLAVYMPT
jgi:hypothetical protein